MMGENFTEAVLPVPFCAFCLRENPPNVEFYKHVVGSTVELRRSFQTMLGYDFQLANFSICKPCWKLMQLVQDFRLRCFKANSLAERTGYGLRSDDDWFSVKNLAIIESVRMVIKDQVAHIERVEVFGENYQTTELSGHAQMDVLESRVGVSVIKIESVVSLNAKAAREDPGSKISTEAIANENMDGLGNENKHLFECSRCGRLFSVEKSLKIHLKKCSGKPAKDIITCQECLATFHHRYQFETHMNGHLGKTPYKCRKHCTKEFPSRFARRSHEVKCLQNDERKCSWCEETFPNCELLQEHHLTVHPAKKTYACKLCDVRCSRVYELKFHMQLKHEKSASKHPCPICGKLFTVHYNIKPHIEQVHGGRRDHQCEICKKRFTNRTCLRGHMASFHPEAASEYCRALLARKQARSKERRIRRSMENPQPKKKSRKSEQQTLHDFQGFGEVEA